MARFTKASDVLKDITQTVERAVNQFLYKLNIEVARLTPKRTGRAQRGWRVVSQYQIGRTRAVIENKVPYISLLEMGYSKQAPNGMIGPALRTMTRRKYRL